MTRSRIAPDAVLLLLALVTGVPAAAQSPAAPSAPATAPPAAPSSASQKTKVEAGVFSVPLTVREQFLGRSGDKTAVRFVLSVSKDDVRKAISAGPRFYSFFIAVDAKTPEGKPVESFRVPVDVDLSEQDAAKPFEATFLRALPPGAISLEFRLEGVAGKAIGVKAVGLTVPVMTSEFRAVDAGVDAKGMPSASAVVIEAENRAAIPGGGDGTVKILAPKKEVPIGLLRVEAEVKPPVERVEFWLGEKKILARNRPPYTVELDLGAIPRRQTLKAIGFDKLGNFVDEDAWAINEKDARLAIRILELPSKPAADTTDFKVTVQSIAGGVAKTLTLFVDAEPVKEWSGPPYLFSLPKAKLARATLLRATAVDDEGKEFTDIRFLKGDQRFVSKVEVNLVELNVSVLDTESKFVKGLTKGDFVVSEDGQKQEINGFEFSESLPISLGVVIDGSGSMKSSMPIVHEAAGDFVTKMIGEKDQGFVMEFREAPVVLASMTKNRADLMSAVQETRAQGATALYDSVVMALYQFRAVPGKKALVLLTDGKDNHSWTDYDTVKRYARTAGVPIFFIGLDLSFLDVGLKSKMKEIAGDTGADAFFVGNAKELPEVYRKIEAELRSQYFVTYLTNSKKPDDQYRVVDVKLTKPGLRAKTIRGYFP